MIKPTRSRRWVPRVKPQPRWLNPCLLCALLLLASASSLRAATTTPASQPTDFHGYPQQNLTIDTLPALLVSPKQSAPGNPWIWRAEFFNTAPQLDLALLAKGYHLAFIKVGNTFGAPSAMKHWNVFYHELTENYHLSPKPVLEGLSRGGLYCFNWAIAHPDDVGAIVCDNAVFDFKSWPGGQGKSPKSDKDWAALLKVYGFQNDAEAFAYKGNPIDNLQPLADHHVPLFILYADADQAAIPEENALRLIDLYQKLGGTYDVHIKHGMGHHPHGLDDPTPIVTFLDKVCPIPATTPP
jgi:pimeloyl-ACP methyl ester carboxylesterase